MNIYEFLGLISYLVFLAYQCCELRNRFVDLVLELLTHGTVHMDHTVDEVTDVLFIDDFIVERLGDEFLGWWDGPPQVQNSLSPSRPGAGALPPLLL